MTEPLTSRHNPLFKTLLKLAQQRRERLKSRLTLLDGPHLVDAALSAAWPLQRLMVTAEALTKPELAALLQRWQGSSPVLLADNLFAELSELPTPSGILALTEIPPQPQPLRQGCVLLLDGVQDPGNVGSMLRTAAAAGVDQVWLSASCADVWSPKVLRAGMGAHFVVPVVERADLLALLADFAGELCVTALADDAVSLYQHDLRGNLALAMGSEGAGVSPALLTAARHKLMIPMREGIESLNVAAATAVCLFERLRQIQYSP